MSSTLLRLGLWITLAVVALYVIGETYSGFPVAEYFPMSMLEKGLALGLLLVVAGVVARVFEKGASKVVVKNRCVVCKTSIPPGAIYCRAHLRSMLHREEDRTHQTKTHR
jgi:predicted nucleic acid-binding Zn ribbon protein